MDEAVSGFGNELKELQKEKSKYKRVPQNTASSDNYLLRL